jgi:hypothetical protein
MCADMPDLDKLLGPFLRNKAGAGAGMVLVGIIAAAVLANKRRRSRTEPARR